MRTVHLVSHTHWDREWYLTFQQFRLKLVHLMDGLINILENNRDYKYYLLDGQTIILEDYLEIRPERKKQIIKFINKGRLLIGPWYISPDEFLLSAESHIRNLIEGDRLCQEFGGIMPVGYLPDTFGHIGQMPQILQGFDIKYACAWRGLDDQQCELIWEAPDGSNVLLSFLRESYSNAASLTNADTEHFIKDIGELCTPLSENMLTNQILLMNGTDHTEPSSDITKAIDLYQAIPHKDILIHSNLLKYFNAIETDITDSSIYIPVIKGELRSSKRTAILPNVLSTRIMLKQRNRNCENKLLKWVEPLFAYTNFLDLPTQSSNSEENNINHQNQLSQKSIIRYAWRLLMKCHPHDSICGTLIDQVANELILRFDQVDQITNELIDQELYGLSERINTNLSDHLNDADCVQNLISSVIVFNPNDCKQSGIVNLRTKIDQKYSTFDIIDQTGKNIPYHHQGKGNQELISMALDKKSLKQAIGMIHEGNVAGLVIRDFELKKEENHVEIRVTLSDHGVVELQQWKQGIADLELLFSDPSIDKFVIHAYSDPETELSFIVDDIPEHGYKCYWVQGKNVDFSGISEPRIKYSRFQIFLPLVRFITQIPLLSKLNSQKKLKFKRKYTKIENDYFVVEIQRPVEDILITDKRTNQKYLGQNVFIDSGDCGDVYNYCPPENDVSVKAKIRNIDLIDNGITQKLLVHYEMRLPESITPDRKFRSKKRVINSITSTLTLVSGIPRIDIHTEIENLAKDHRLRVHFKAPFDVDHAYHDGQFEVVERQVGLPEYDDTWAEQPRPEVPQGDYTILTSGGLSLLVANRGLPEVEVIRINDRSSEIAVSLLRCIGWLSRDDLSTRKGHAGPMGITTPEAQMIGKYSFDYSIIPGDSNLSKSIHQAIAFNAPLQSVSSTIHSGILPPTYSFISSDNPDFIITSIKMSETGHDLILRGYNRQASPIQVNLKIWKTFIRAYQVQLNEKIIHEIPLSQDSQVHLSIEGNKILTIRFSD